MSFVVILSGKYATADGRALIAEVGGGIDALMAVAVADLTEYTIPEGVKAIALEVFYACTFLKSVNMPNGLEMIAADAFCDCLSLQSVTIPDSVKYIYDGAFYGCPIESVTIPSNVVTIGTRAFYKDLSMTVYSKPTTAPMLGNEAFNNPKVIYVPTGSEEEYKAQWSSYSSVITGYTF